MNQLPFSQACENNKSFILEILREAFADRSQVLEIGSGTGQHAVYFAPEFPQLQWQTSDRVQHHAGVNAWLEAYPAPNLMSPLALDVSSDSWPAGAYDAVFSANTAHIMHCPVVVAMLAGVGRLLQDLVDFTNGFRLFYFGNDRNFMLTMSFDQGL